MQFEELERLIVAKLLWAREEGCPGAPQNEELANSMASMARRRWESYERRGMDVQDTVGNRIIDLARGMAEKFERGGWSIVGPLMRDYQWLAEQIASTLVTAKNDLSE